MKNFIAALVALAGLGLGGCAVDADTATAPDDGIGSKEQAMGEHYYCADPGGLKKMRSTLAVVMAKEFGRIDPLLDLKITQIPVYWGSMEAIGVSNAGLARCNQRGMGSCDNVQSILALQDPGINGEPATNWQASVDRSVLDGAQFASVLVSGYRDQVTREHQDPHYGGPQSQVELTFFGTEDYWFACGTHFKFFATGDWERLEQRFYFFGYNPNNRYDLSKNAYFAYDDTGGIIQFDPDANLTGDMTVTSGACVNACVVYGSSFNGDCCACNGRLGDFRRLRRNTFSCR